jgi:dolichol kinase
MGGLLEIRRQLFHVFLGIVVVILYYFNLIDAFMVFVVVVLGGFLCFLSKKLDIPVLSWFLRKFEREEQIGIFPGRGMLFFFIGILLVMKLFEKDIALAAIMILALGDSVSHLVGKFFGKTRNIFNGHSRKLLEGTIAGAVFGFLGALLFVPIPEAFFGSLGAMVVEALEFDMNKRTIDDNLIIPLVAGTIMLLVRNYL